MRAAVAIAALLLGCQAPPDSFSLTPVTPPCASDAASKDFVQVCQGDFSLGGRRFPVVGANAYYLLEEATRELAKGAKTSATVEEVMSELVSLRATVVRAWAFNDEPKKDTALQTAPGKLNENALRGLDHVIRRAEAHGLKLILTLVNYWPDYGGVDQYLKWHKLTVGQSEDRARSSPIPRCGLTSAPTSSSCSGASTPRPAGATPTSQR